MWEISGNTRWILITATAGLALFSAPAFAVDTTVYQNNSQYGMTLPNVSLPSGSDEIRAGDGTSCRSAVGGDGAYIDTGIIGSPGGNGLEQSGSFYSRVVIPLGEKPRRLNCSTLYELEVQRLRMELQLARMGLESHGQVTNSTSKTTSSAIAQSVNDGWSNEGITKTEQPKKIKSKSKSVAKTADPVVVPVADAPISTPVEIITSIY
jgi:hypothetical protein